MPSLNLAAKQIKGLLPALDARTVGTPYIMRGKNFLLDAEGPHAAFCGEIVTYAPLGAPQVVQTFRLDQPEDFTIIATRGGFLRYDYATKRYYVVYTFTDTGELAPWYMAEISNKFYFARLGVTGIIQFDPVTNTWQTITSFIPNDPFALVASGGRLIVLGSSQVAWSAGDVGSDFTPSTVTGAGFQGLSLVGGTGIALASVADGFISLTTKGIMKSEFTGVANPFRHKKLPNAEQIVPVNRFCAIQVLGDSCLILDKKGLFTCDGGTPQPFEPIFSEFISGQLLPKLNLNTATRVKLSYADDLKQIFLSVASEADTRLMQYAYVFYMPRGEWGMFNRLHYAIADLYLNDGPNVGYQTGYIDARGYLHKFNLDNNIHEEYPTDALYYWYQSDFDIPARIQSDVTVFSSNAKIRTVNPNLFAGQSGLYKTALVAHPIAPAIIPLPVDLRNSFTDEGQVIDYLLIADDTDDEDWNSGTGAEDWASGSSNAFRFTSSIGMESGFKAFIVNAYQRVRAPINAEIEVGLFRYTEQQYDDELSSLTNIAIGIDKFGGTQDFEDFADPDEDSIVDYATSTSRDEDYGFGTVSGTVYKLTCYSTIDGKTVFADNQSEPFCYDETSGTKMYSAYSVGLHHVIRLTANEVGETFHLRSLELSGSLCGRLR